MSELFDAVDALVASRSPLPPPEERKRLRQAHGLTLDEVAAALKVRRATVSGWESSKTRTEPRPPEREAYARLLEKLAELYPAPTDTATPTQDTAPVPETFTGAPAPAEIRTPPSAQASDAAATITEENTQTRPAADTVTAPAAAARPARTARTSPTSRRPSAKKAAKKTTADAADPRFENGPLAVVDCEDGVVSAYCVGGLVWTCPPSPCPRWSTGR